MSDQIRGSCLCGGIAYRADGPFFRSSHCYCGMCQKQHGAAAGSYVNVPTEGFAWEHGRDLLQEFESSEHGRRGFCKVCGSTLTWRSTQAPDRIALAMGALDTPFDHQVEREWYAERKPAWLPVK
jgi:hypothetical protein